MSRSSWVAAITLVLTIALVSWYSIHQVRIYQIEKADQRQSVAEAEARDLYECFNRFAIPSFMACVYDVSQADAETQRSNYDLQAQQEMAVWAYAMFISTIAVIFITTLAAVFAWRQVLESRRIGEAQTRAYMTASGAEAVYRDGQFHVTIHAQNTGQSPAHAVTTQTFIALEPPPFDEAWLEDKCDTDMKSDVGAGQTIFLLTKGPKKPDRNLLANMTLNEWKVWVYATIGYDDVFGRPHTTRCCYELEYHSNAKKYGGKIMPVGNSMN